MKKVENFLIIVCLAVLPLVCCVVTCMGSGITITDIYLPNSMWNDEVMYFKMLEGSVEYGVPQGYFGYNESSAVYLGFGPWSPLLLLFPWIFGKITGCSLLTPVLCNIFLMSVAMFLFAVSVKPSKMQAAAVGGLYALFSVCTRYILSGMQEASCYFLVILMTALFYRGVKITEGYKRSIFILLNLVVMLLTLMRPYYVMFAVLPGYYAYSYRKDKRFLYMQAAAAVLDFAGYMWVSRYLCAAYLGPVIQTEWISLILERPAEGMFHLGYKLVSSLKTMLTSIGAGITDGDAGGACYTVYILLACWILYKGTQCREDGKKRFLWVYMLMVSILMLLAIFLFYDVTVGSRHLIPFILCGMVILGMNGETGKSVAAAMLVMLWLFGAKGTDAYIYNIPAVTDEMNNEIMYGRELLNEKIVIDPKAGRWDNTVIWLLSDESGVTWQDLYAFPAGIGISLCTREYVMENYGQLKSKYLMTNSNGEAVEILCSRAGAQLIAEYGQTHVWKLRDSFID